MEFVAQLSDFLTQCVEFGLGHGLHPLYVDGPRHLVG